MFKSLLVVLIVAFSSVGWGYQITGDKFLMYFEKVILSIQAPELSVLATRVEYNNSFAVVSYDVKSPAANQKTVDLTFQPAVTRNDIKVTKFSLTMTLTEIGGYFYLTNTTANLAGEVTNDGKTNKFGSDNPFQLISQITLEAPRERSFHCSRFGRLYPDFNAKVGNYTPSVEFIQLQVQAFSNATDAAKPVFLDSWDCVGFFTIGIWSGLFIASMLIGIITLGLAMIMNVKTMDRFDDPKGKPISFGGTE